MKGTYISSVQFSQIEIYSWLCISIYKNGKVEHLTNERVKRVLYTIYQTCRYNALYKRVKRVLYTISHYHKMKGQRQIISSYLNDHNLLNAERYTTDETIPPYKTTSI